MASVKLGGKYKWPIMIKKDVPPHSELQQYKLTGTYIYPIWQQRIKFYSSIAKRMAKQALLLYSKNKYWYNTLEVNLILPIKI